MGRAQNDLLATEHPASRQRPVLALDVDGVIFPLPEKPRSSILPTYPGWVDTVVSNLPVSYDPELAAWLRGLQKEGVEIAWASDWGESCSKIAEELGLSPTAVIDIERKDRYGAVSAYAAGRVLVWCEDQPQNPAVKAALRTRTPPALLVRPKRHLGLTSQQRARISKWLTDLPS